MKKLIIFDLDGTLAESKSALNLETAKLLSAKEAGGRSIRVRNPNEPKRGIEAIIACLSDEPLNGPTKQET